MPEVIFAGPEGRLEGRYHHSKENSAPIALILHPHPKHLRAACRLRFINPQSACLRSATWDPMGPQGTWSPI